MTTMTRHPLGPTIEPTEKEIQHRAYFLWQAEGRPVGQDRELWQRAREALRCRPVRPLLDEEPPLRDEPPAPDPA